MNWVSLFFFFSVFFFGFGCCFFFSTQVDFFYLSTGSPEAHRRRGGVQPGAGGRRAGHLATGIGPLGNFLSKNKKKRWRPAIKKNDFPPRKKNSKKNQKKNLSVLVLDGRFATVQTKENGKQKKNRRNKSKIKRGYEPSDGSIDKKVAASLSGLVVCLMLLLTDFTGPYRVSPSV